MPYLERVGCIVDVCDGHIAAVLCALAIRFAQLEGFCLQWEEHTIIYVVHST